MIAAGIDPGLTDGAVVVVDLTTLELLIVIPMCLKPKNDKRRTGISLNEIGPLVTEWYNKNMAYLMEDIHCVWIETQMKTKLWCVQAVFQSLLHGKCFLSSPVAVRNHFGLRVCSKTLADEVKRKTGKRSGKRTLNKLAYTRRKQLSIDFCKKHIPTKTRLLCDEIATKYWQKSNKDNWRAQACLTRGERNAKIRKTYSDIVEAYILTVCPVNWRKAGIAKSVTKARKTKKQKNTKKIKIKTSDNYILIE